MTFVESTETTLMSLDLAPKHSAFITIVLSIAESLDNSPRLSASLLAEYLKTLRFLIKESSGEESVDPLEQLLASGN